MDGSPPSGRLLEPEFLEAVLERSIRQAEEARRFRDDPTGLLHRLNDELPFEFLDVDAVVGDVEAIRAHGRSRAQPHVGGEILGADDDSLAEEHGAPPRPDVSNAPVPPRETRAQE